VLEVSIRKIQQEFKASNYMVWTSKKLVAEKGILSSPASTSPWLTYNPEWQALVNMVTNLQVPQKAENFLIS
jgi:hypothetical protein